MTVGREMAVKACKMSGMDGSVTIWCLTYAHGRKASVDSATRVVSKEPPTFEPAQHIATALSC